MTIKSGEETKDAAIGRRIREAGDRARAEAEMRRRQAEASAKPRPTEVNGSGGPDPVRHGDWEVKGIASDF